MKNKASKDFLAIATQYIDDVISGKIVACQWVRKACERQLRDLANQKTEAFPYRFDPAKAVKICKFIELLSHVKGDLAGKHIVLEPWQVFILTTVFGWIRPDGGRRFRRSYIEVPRGNGKSSLSSGVALYCLTADEEKGAEVYSFATTRDQAKIVFGDAKAMADGNSSFKRAFGVQVLANAVWVPATNSTFQAKSAEGSTLDGLNTHLAVVDELHAHKTRAVYDVVETSLGKRKSSLMWVITTAGFDTSGICYEVRTMATKVLDNEIKEETQFAIIYGIDPEDRWDTEDALKKANPNWGISVRPEMILALLQKAKALPSAANNFKTKHLDMWCSAGNAWMDMDAWRKCSENLDLSDFDGKDCYIGLDLGAKNDLTAKVRVFPVEADGGTKYYVFGDFYVPQTAKEKSGNSQYDGWETLGFLQVTDGAVTDFDRVETDLEEDLRRFNVQAVAYDPWQATQLASHLSDAGAPMVEYRNTVQNMSEPMKMLEALVADGRIIHDGNPAMTWMMGNVTAKRDMKDNIFPRKERYENKIDGAVALIMCLGQALNDEDREPESTDFDAWLSL